MRHIGHRRMGAIEHVEIVVEALDSSENENFGA